MIQTKRNFVFDFDSTLTSVEALDVLAEITLVNNPDKIKLLKILSILLIWELMEKFLLQNH